MGRTQQSIPRALQVKVNTIYSRIIRLDSKCYFSTITIRKRVEGLCYVLVSVFLSNLLFQYSCQSFIKSNAEGSSNKEWNVVIITRLLNAKHVMICWWVLGALWQHLKCNKTCETDSQKVYSTTTISSGKFQHTTECTNTHYLKKKEE